MKISFLHFQLLTAILTVAILAGCDKVNTTVKYKVTFNFNWNQNDYASDYPSNAHFSKLIGWSHKPDNDFFENGTLASAGIQSMAETGQTETLEVELRSKIEAGEGYLQILGSSLGSGVEESEIEIEVDQTNSAITLATMIAPSPDWYVAIVNIDLQHGGEFIKELTVEAQSYDAGTDSGTDFTSPNSPSSPKGVIGDLQYSSLGDLGAVGSFSQSIALVTIKKK